MSDKTKFSPNEFFEADKINKGNEFEGSDALHANDVNMIVNNQLHLKETKANLHSPAFTGVPTAPTAVEAATKTVQIATTQFVHNAIDAKRPYATETPLMDSGEAKTGSSEKVAKADHVHPTDTTRQALLISGENIRTIGNKNILGTGNLAASDIGAEPAFGKNSAFNKNFGTTNGTVCDGNDSRLSDARTPTVHSHTISQITDFSHSHAASEIGLGNVPNVNCQNASNLTSGTVNQGRLPYASQSLRGAVRMHVSGTTLYLYNQ